MKPSHVEMRDNVKIKGETDDQKIHNGLLLLSKCVNCGTGTILYAQYGTVLYGTISEE